MEDKEDTKFCVSTYECSGSFKIHSVISFKDLDDLKAQLKVEGYTSVGLIKFGWFDERENCVEGSIRVDDIKPEHIGWCTEKSGEDRYLALYRH
jgi:hypothetical protein